MGTDDKKVAPPSKGSTYVKLVNTHKAPLGLPPLSAARIKTLGLSLQGEHLHHQLAPGDNNVHAEHWHAVKDQAPVRNWIEEGYIREGSTEDGKAPQGKSYRESLDGTSHENAMKLIEHSDDKDQIAKWHKSEKRAEVKEALKTRFEALNAGK